MKIIIQTIPHTQQRYDTVGDYWTDLDGTWQFRVSKMSNWRYEFLVAVHELTEKALCELNGVTEAVIDEFDFNFKGDGEPGNDPQAPYREEHQAAINIEMDLATILRVNWREYEAEVDSLDYKPAPTICKHCGNIAD